MDGNKSSQDILDEILNRPPKEAPSPTSYPPPESGPVPSDYDIPLPPLKVPKEKAGPDMAATLLPYLCMVLGAALLVMGICLLQLARMNHRLDELRQAVEEVREVDRLREENEQLQQNVEELQERAEQAERDSENFLADRDRIIQTLNVTTIQKWRGDYLFYIGQFMDNGDYCMAVLVTALSAEVYFNNYYSSQAVYLNPAQAAQYQAYRQELVDKGYLWEKNSGPSVGFPDQWQWNPEKNPDMAALSILWCALEQQYIFENPEVAVCYLSQNRFVSPQGDLDGQTLYVDRLYHTASDYTIGLYEQLIRDLTEAGYLVEQDGVLMETGMGTGTDMLYYLPFDPPNGD